jgi:hypothetical protein
MRNVSLPQHEGCVFVLFDIGSASIGAGIVTYEHGEIKVLWNSRIEYGYQSVDDFERYTHTMYATLLEIGMKVKGEGLSVVKQSLKRFHMNDVRVFCVLGAPWFYGAVEYVEEKKDKPFQITPTTLDALIDTGYEAMLQKKNTQMWQEVMGESEILETYINQVKVRGYAVKQYMNQTVKEVEARIYISLTPQAVKAHVREVLEKLFPNHDTDFVSSTHILSGKSYTQHTQERILLVEVGGEMTNVSLLQYGTACTTTTFSHGTNHVLRAITPKATNAKEARGPVTVMLKKLASAKSFDEIPEALEAPMEAWHNGFVHALGTVSGGVTPPRTVALVTGVFWNRFYTAILAKQITLPGIRKKVTLEMCPIFNTVSKNSKKVTKDTVSDTRLYAVTQALQDYTHKKTMCYTKNK